MSVNVGILNNDNSVYEQIPCSERNSVSCANVARGWRSEMETTRIVPLVLSRSGLLTFAENAGKHRDHEKIAKVSSERTAIKVNQRVESASSAPSQSHQAGILLSYLLATTLHP